jgi:hypothetical protein
MRTCVLLLAVALGCGSMSKGGSPAKATATVEPGPLVAAPDLEGKTLEVAVRSPAATLATLRSLVPLPESYATPEGIAGYVLEGNDGAAALIPAIDFNAPVFDVNTAQGSDNEDAVSFGLGSFSAFERIAPLVEHGPGVWRIDGVTRCLVARSLGPSEARLVCGFGAGDVDHLTPYPTRRGPLARSTADIHVDFGGEGLNVLGLIPSAWLAPESLWLPMGPVAATARARELLALQLTREIFPRDTTRLAVDLDVDAWRLQGKVRVERAAAAPAGEPGPIPEAFWRLPGDSDLAFFSRDPRDPEVATSRQEMVREVLGALDIGTEDDRASLAALARAPWRVANVVYATGHNARPARADDAQRAFDRERDGHLGWHLVGADEGADAVTAWVDELLALHARRASGWSTLVRRGAPPGLDSKTFEVELSIPHLSAESLGAGTGEVTFRYHAIVMPDGPTTWLAFGPNRGELIARLNGARHPEGGLAAREDLSSLRSGAYRSGGFLSIRAMTQAALSVVWLMKGLHTADTRVRDERMLLAILPHRGESPIVFTRVADELTLAIPSGALTDAIQTAERLAP